SGFMPQLPRQCTSRMKPMYTAAATMPSRIALRLAGGTASPRPSTSLHLGRRLEAVIGRRRRQRPLEPVRAFPHAVGRLRAAADAADDHGEEQQLRQAETEAADA